MADEITKPASPTFIHGNASNQQIDSSGEIVDLAGLDCSSLLQGCLNWEHQNSQPNQVVGKILEYKKIFSEKDCENEHHKYFWDKCKSPFLYIMGRLFDDKKESSKEVAALFQDDAEHPDEPPMVGFSVEGSKINRTGITVDKSIARKITITCMPCNKSCVAEIVKNPDIKADTDTDSIFKSEPTHTIELLEKAETGYEKGIHTSRASQSALGSVNSKDKQMQGMSSAGMHTRLGGSGNKVEAKTGHIQKLSEMKQMPKPNLDKKEVPGSKIPSAHSASSQAKPVKGASGWSHSGGGNFSHPEHGIVSVVKEGNKFNVKHGGALAGVGGKKGSFGSMQEAGAHAGDYMRSLSQGKTIAPAMHERPSPSMTKGFGGIGMMGGGLPPESTDKKNKRGLFNPDVDKITTRGTMMGGGMGMGRSEKKSNLKKAMTAGSGIAAPGNLVQGAALAPESVDKKMKKALWFRKAEECYKLWEKREQFENFMTKHLPGLTKGEISAIGATLALRKSMRAEKKLAGMIRDQGQDSWVKKKEK